MAQFYARVFVQILDSSIAEDFMVRHTFEDLMKVCDISGVVDMTRQALSRRFNVPLDELNRCLEKLEAPDPASRDQDFEGRRIERIDDHRDWGWRILNFKKYEEIRTRADVAIRQQRHRDRKKGVTVPPEIVPGDPGTADGKPRPTTTDTPPMMRVRITNRPASVEEVIEAGKMLGLEEGACRKFWDTYEGTAKDDGNGKIVWVTGPEEKFKIVGNWRNVLATWKANDDDRLAQSKAKHLSAKEARREAADPGTPVAPLPVQTFTATPASTPV